MAKRSADDDETVTAASTSSGVERLTNLLALLVVKGHNQVESIKLLNRAGFQAREIAALLGTTRNTVSVAISNAKKNGKKKTRGSRGKN